jgi:hypothetical protein
MLVPGSVAVAALYLALATLVPAWWPPSELNTGETVFAALAIYVAGQVVASLDTKDWALPPRGLAKARKVWLSDHALFEADDTLAAPTKALLREVFLKRFGDRVWPQGPFEEWAKEPRKEVFWMAYADLVQRGNSIRAEVFLSLNAFHRNMATSCWLLFYAALLAVVLELADLLVGSRALRFDPRLLAVAVGGLGAPFLVELFRDKEAHYDRAFVTEVYRAFVAVNTAG